MGLQQDHEAPKQLSAMFYTVVQRVEDRIGQLDDDPSTQDAMIDISRALELDLYKLRSLQLGE